MKQGKAVVLIFSCFLSSSAWCQDENTTLAEYRIRNVYIRSLDVFDSSHEEFDSWPFRIANRFHIKTRNSLIRSELLVAPGDLLNKDLIRESERNLRRYSFLSDVSIKTVRVSANEVDLEVGTEDQWTTTPILSIGQTKGERSFDFGIEEENFLGLGKKMSLKYEQNRERRNMGGSYVDPRLFDTTLRLNLRLADSSDGYRALVELTSPFYSQSTKWAYVIRLDGMEKTEHLYYRSVDAATLDYRNHTAVLSLTRAWGERYRKRRAGVSLSYQGTTYPGEAEILDEHAASQQEIQANLNPANKELWNFGIHLEADRQRFVKFYYLDKFGRTEDLPVGRHAGCSFFVSTNNIGRDFLTGVLFSRWSYVRSSQYFVSFASLQIRREGNLWNNMIAESWVHYFMQTGAIDFGFLHSPRQTLAVGFSSILSNEVEAPFQVSLGESEGLRGYPFKSFTGENKILLNLEERVFTPWENRFAGIALVPFVDAGYIWSKDRQTNDFGASVGIGLRIGFKKYGRTKVLRLDAAFPLANAEDRGISFSVASGHVFDVL